MISEHYAQGEITSANVTTSIVAFKKKEVGMVRLWGVGVNASANNQVLGTLPDGYRPSTDVGVYCPPSASGVVRVVVHNTGVINAFNTEATARTVYVTITYLLE